MAAGGISQCFGRRVRRRRTSRTAWRGRKGSLPGILAEGGAIWLRVEIGCNEFFISSVVVARSTLS